MQDFGIQKDNQHGLDHGIWSVLVHVFPNEQIPISVLTLDINKSFSDHMKIAEKLTKLNTEDTLIFASGNIVHNLRAIDWDHMDDNFAFSWAKNVNDYLKENFYVNNLEKLVNLPKNSEFSLAIPTRDHYLPFLYIAAMRAENSEIITFNDEIVGGSISMTSFLVL